MDQNFLNEKTQGELVAICEERGIKGMGGQPKDLLITILLNDMAEKDGIPTKEDLEAKSLTELREIVSDMDIYGLDKQPKSVIVEVILNAHAKAVLTAVQAVVTVSKNDCGNVSSKISVSCGGSGNEFPVVGNKVDDIATLLREVLNIPENAIATIDGVKVNNDYVVKEGDTLDFEQHAEVKG